MKKLFILIGLVGGLLSAQSAEPAAPKEVPNTVMPSKDDAELAWVDEQIRAILPARVGIADGLINSLGDPMKLKKPVLAKSGMLPPPKLGALVPPKVVEEPLRLMALMNKSALISGKWYKVGDGVRNFSLSEIKPSSVSLTGKKGQQLILFLTKQNNKIQITTK